MSAVPSGRDIPLRSAHDLYALVDELGPHAVGELFVTGPDGARGAVFIEQGRICWAAALGLAPRLTQLLLEHAGVTPAEMEAIFLSCKANRAPLGEHLLRIGVLGEHELRGALLQHTIESMRRLFDGHARASWCRHGGKGYSATFTFTTAEVCARMGSAGHAVLAAEVAPVLASAFEGAHWAAAFVRTRECAFPEPIAHYGTGMTEARTLLRLGRWAASVLDMIAAFNDESAMLAVMKRQTTLVAFRQGEAIVVGETGEHGPARILNLRARARRDGRSGNAHL